ncbi:MAG: exodeoxyribonuclease VII small subunit [Methanotrichaceae archaeon]
MDQMGHMGHVGQIASKDDLNLEEALNDLEQIVADIEDGRLSLEESLELFEKGVKLVRLCNSKLDIAEQRIESLTGEVPEDLAGR